MLLRQVFRLQKCQSISQQVRSYAPRGTRSDMLPKRVDPGVKRHTKLLQDMDDYLDDPEGFGNFESDFSEVHKVHKEYEREVVFNEEKIKQLMVKNKYFKEQTHNFLTWSEKEQMRQMHSKDPDVWTVEKLAESFPSNIPGVAKIVKAQWVPRDGKAVQKHDERVKRAWNMFRKNQCKDLDPQLVEHLKKFSHRNFDNTSANLSQKALAANKYQFPKPSKTEFTSIITSCKGFKSETPNITAGQTSEKGVTVKGDKTEIRQPMPNDNDTYLLEKTTNRNYIQFDQVKKPKGHNEVKEWEKSSMNPFDDSNNSGVITLKLQDDFNPVERADKHDLKMAAYEESSNAVEKRIDEVREHITIPKKLFQKGATYQLKDCFYDSDGELLYRVPGMTGLRRT